LALPDFPARIAFSDKDGVPTPSSARWMAAVARFINLPRDDVYDFSSVDSPVYFKAQTYGTINRVGGILSNLTLTRNNITTVLSNGTITIPVSPGDIIEIEFTLYTVLKFIPT
jgi:hypothetical protein